MKANRPEDARTQFEKLLADRATPQGISERARIAMATMTAADLAKATPAATTEIKAAPACNRYQSSTRCRQRRKACRQSCLRKDSTGQYEEVTLNGVSV